MTLHLPSLTIEIPYDAIITWVLACKSVLISTAGAAKTSSPTLTLPLPSTPTPTLTDCILLTCLAAATGYGIFAFTVFTQHEKEFGGNRLSRNHGESPTSSKLEPPDVRNWKSNQQQVLTNSKLHPKNFASCELLGDVEEVNHNRLTYAPKKSSDKTKKAELLDMDHIYVNYFQLLWAFTFVGPCSYLLWKKGVTMLRLRVFLAKIGLVKKKPVDLEALVGKLMLEQSQAIHYFAKTKKDSKLGNVAGFFFADFPYVDNNGKMQIADLLAVDIDLDTRKMVKCKMDGEHLTPSEALILLWYNTISAQHVKLHSFGNWGVNIDDDVKELNPFLHTSSLVTVVYNYFGFSSFPRFMKEWKRLGLLSKDWDPQSFISTVEHGVKQGVWQHSHIVELVPYSNFVSFITKARTIFHAEFKRYKHLFPGVHAEGLFTGTVLHSLDHAFMDWNLEDPLWLDVDDPKYGKMAELGRIVKVGFVPEVEGYYFHRKWKGSGHPFYEAVYRKVVKIDRKIADAMDTCICR